MVARLQCLSFCLFEMYVIVVFVMFVQRNTTFRQTCGSNKFVQI